MEVLRRSRGGYRAALNKISQKLEDAVEQNDKLAVEINYALLKERESKVKNADQAIIDEMIKKGASEEEIGDELSDSDEWFRNILIKRKAAEDYLVSFARRTTSAVTVTSNAGPSAQTAVHSTVSSSVKLPKLEIKKFYGELKDWQRFWGQFHAAVHSNSSLSNLQRFNYLQCLVGGQAEAALMGIALSDDNYTIAVQRLQDRFGQKNLIIHSHMSQLLSLESLWTDNSVTSLRKLYDTCAGQTESLEALGVDVNSYGALLTPIILKLLPELVLQEWNRKPESKDFVFKDLMDFLKAEVEGMERTILVRSQNVATEKTPRIFGSMQKEKLKPTTSALFTQAEQSKGTTEKTAPSNNVVLGKAQECVFCSSKTHRPWECTALGSIGQMKDILKKRGLCFQCLRPNHVAWKCFRSKCQRCNGRHHRILCQQDNRAVPEANFLPKVESNLAEVVPVHSVFADNVGFEKFVVMKLVHFWMEGGGNVVQAQGILDDASHRSFIRKKVVDDLGLVSNHTESLSVKGFGGIQLSEQVFPVVSVRLHNPHTKAFVCQVNLLVIEHISDCQNLTLKAHKLLDDQGLIPALRKDWEFPTGQIDVLFGLDTYWRILTGDNYTLSYGLMASESRFGWVMNGICGNDYGGKPLDVTMMLAVVPVQERWIQKCWDLEVLGIADKTVSGQVLEDERIAQSHFENTIKYVNGRYQVKFPWKEDTSKLANNRQIAMQRLLKQVKLFKQNDVLFERYQQAMNCYRLCGHAEEVLSNSESGRIYYIPHHAVIRDDRLTTKTRIVFDAASHGVGASSLNDCLYVGPNHNPDVLGMLLRFRKHKIVFIADIEKAFLQVSLDPEDRDSTRFLWFPKDWTPSKPVQVVEYNMTRVLFGARPSPFLLAATVRYHLNETKELYPEASADINDNLYVDDYVSGKNTVEAAYQLSQEAKIIMGLASMPLKKWMSNSKELHELWLKDDCNEDLTVQPEQVMQKVLGVQWEPSTDELSIQCKRIEDILNSSGSKRVLLQASARIYDPYGFASPVVIKIRQLFQVAWERQLPWDDGLPEDLQLEWEGIRAGLKGISRLKRKRVLNLQDGRNLQLHVFTDSSTKAYGAVAYLCSSDAMGEKLVEFVLSRGRVSPLKAISIPRLELLGALIGARLFAFLIKHLDLDFEGYLWSDSNIVLCWLQKCKTKLDPFVARRVEEINTLTKGAAWAYCPGKENPADIVSRGENATKLLENRLWWYGPSWLSENKHLWPRQVNQNERLNEVGLRTNTIVVQHVHVGQKMEGLFDLGDYSSLMKVLRITCWIVRFVKNARKCLHEPSLTLNADEIEKAECYWILQTQRANFDLRLWEDSVVEKKVLPGNNLNVVIDAERILRVKGRLEESSIAEEAKHPVVLPGKSDFTRLLVMRSHLRLMHAGVAETLTDLRERFWILKGRQVVKHVINGCSVCKRFRCTPFVVIEAQLPSSRVTSGAAFECCGMDYAGPLFVRDVTGMSKAYILLITCTKTRAVHIELVSNLSTEQFMLAFRRFVARRGLCKVVYSDNAKQFHKAERELKKVWVKLQTSDQVQSFYGKQGIQWRFIVERASWWGGFWERLVKSVKACLKKVLGNAHLGFEELTTVLAEVEAILNSRPLTVVHDGHDDPEPLTPGHFLIGRRILSLPSKEEKEDVQSKKAHILRRWAYYQRLVGHFWKRWLTEYLVYLRSAHTQRHSSSKDPLIKLNDIVLVAEQKVARHLWPLGRITEVIQGRDGVPRSCALILKGSRQVIKRPIQMLCPLELN